MYLFICVCMCGANVSILTIYITFVCPYATFCSCSFSSVFFVCLLIFQLQIVERGKSEIREGKTQQAEICGCYGANERDMILIMYMDIMYINMRPIATYIRISYINPGYMTSTDLDNLTWQCRICVWSCVCEQYVNSS